MDPLIILSRLAMLVYKPEGTKIAIEEKDISFYEPSFYQGILRMYYGDSRNDLVKLTGPILDVTATYGRERRLDKVFFLASEGLIRLKKNYHELEVESGDVFNPEKLMDYVQILNARKNVKKADSELVRVWTQLEIVELQNIFLGMEKSVDDQEKMNKLCDDLDKLLIDKNKLNDNFHLTIDEQ